MVFVEQKSNYLKSFEKENNLTILAEFLWQGYCEEPKAESSVPQRLIYSLIHNDISTIKEVIEDFSARTPNSSSQYIYQDLTIFLFICITKKFGMSQEWLKKYLSERASTETESKEITDTFKNLLNDNLQSTDNKPEIITVYKYIIGINDFDEKVLNKIYEEFSFRNFPFYNSDFLNILALKTIDLIIIAKGLKDFQKSENIDSFLRIYKKRITLISSIIFGLILVLLLSISIYITVKLFFGSKEEVELADKFLTAFGAFSLLSIIGLTWKYKSILEKIKNILNSFFGFSSNT